MKAKTGERRPKFKKGGALDSYNKETARQRKIRPKPKTYWHGPLKMFTAPCEWVLGQSYFIRTVTHHIVGRLIHVTDRELFLEDAAWVSEDGRFSECLATGKVKSADPAPDGQCIVGRGSLIDAYPWNHPLIRRSVPVK